MKQEQFKILLAVQLVTMFLTGIVIFTGQNHTAPSHNKTQGSVRQQKIVPGRDSTFSNYEPNMNIKE